MKKIKNAMLLAIGSITVLTIAMTSCKKDATAAPQGAPTITTVSASTDSVGQILVITGTNFTGATVTVGGVTAIDTVVNSTTIHVKIPSVTAGSGIHVVVTTSAGPVSTDINVNHIVNSGGFISSDSVEHAALLAYWPFNGTDKDTLSGSGSIKAVGESFVADGPFGHALQLTSGYLQYGPLTHINNTDALDQYSISMWVKIAASNASTYTVTSGRYTSLFMVNSLQIGDIYGPMAMTLHTNEAHGTDSFAFGAVLRQVDNHAHTYGLNTTDPTSQDHIDDSTRAIGYAAGAGDGSHWVYVTQTFAGYSPTRDLKTYINGVLVNTRLFYTLIYTDFTTPSNSDNLNLRPGGNTSGGADEITFGTFHFSDDFGATQPWGTTPAAAAASDVTTSDKIYWAHGINAEMSQVRVYNTPLTQTEVTALYQLGLNGQ